jgi:hypothetical protein
MKSEGVGQTGIWERVLSDLRTILYPFAASTDPFQYIMHPTFLCKCSGGHMGMASVQASKSCCVLEELEETKICA